MRGILFFLILALPAIVFGQDPEVIHSGDSLTIRAMNITSDPFNFRSDPLNYLLRLNPKVSLEPVKNIQIENRVDTTYTLLLGSDKFSVYKLDKMTNFLMVADIVTTKFKTKHKIAIGTTKPEVLRVFKDFNITTIPDLLVLENLEVAEYLTFKFTRGKVTRIIYEGYID